MATDREAIGIAGIGRMGRGIALAFAPAGHAVTLIDLKVRSKASFDATARDALDEIRRDLDFLVSVAALTGAQAEAAIRNMAFVGKDDAPAALATQDIVFEGVPETVPAKQDCFAVIGAHARPDCLVASTTSTMDADTLAAMLEVPERFLNAHWLNPAHLMPLVELSPSRRTAPDMLARMQALLDGIGKVTVVCKASPGYIVPRIQALAMNEAARMVEEGVATAEDIDTAIRVGFGPRFSVLGLLEFIDWGGGDTLHRASTFLSDRLDHGRFSGPPIIDVNMREKRRGLRDGKGFYDYRDVDMNSYRNKRMTALVNLLRSRGLMPARLE